MIATATKLHILALEIVGPARSSAPELSLSLSILLELVATSETCELAKSEGDLSVVPTADTAYLLFRNGPSAPARAAFELWEMLHELPSMSVRLVLHFGEAAVIDGGLTGTGIDHIGSLLETVGAGQIVFSEAYSESLNAVESSGDLSHVSSQRLVILETEAPDSTVAGELVSALHRDGHEAERDSVGKWDLAWAREMESRIRAADAVVAILSEGAEESELLQYQLEIAEDERRKRGRPYIVPVWLKEGLTQDGTLAALQRNLRQAFWRGSEDTGQVVDEVRAVLSTGQAETEPEVLTSAGGAVAGDSQFYVRRLADQEFEEALNRHESIILVKGPRQIGKTSLIGRGVRYVDEKGWRRATTDFQKLSAKQLESDSSFYRVVATTLARQLNFEFDFDAEWIEALGENMNMDGFMTALLDASDVPLVWFMDEADRLFGSPFASDFFGLVRSWHNARATDWRGPWSRLTIVIGYATEAHLFIKDLNQSPFNVGCPIELAPFSLENTVDLNERYGRPIAHPQDVQALQALVGGQPFLTRRALDVLAKGKMTVEELFADADKDDGPFGDHLKRLLVSVTQLPNVWDALMQSLGSPNLADSDGLHRLVAAGVLVRRSDRGYELPYELYKRFLARYASTGRQQ